MGDQLGNSLIESIYAKLNVIIKLKGNLINNFFSINYLEN